MNVILNCRCSASQIVCSTLQGCTEKRENDSDNTSFDIFEFFLPVIKFIIPLQGVPRKVCSIRMVPARFMQNSRPIVNGIIFMTNSRCSFVATNCSSSDADSATALPRRWNSPATIHHGDSA